MQHECFERVDATRTHHRRQQRGFMRQLDGCIHTHTHTNLTNLCDRGALEGLRAVLPPMGTGHALSAVAEQRRVARETARILESQVQDRTTGTISALMGRRGSGENAHHHVESEEDLR